MHKIMPGYLSEHTFDIVDVLTEIATEKKCTTSQIAMAWVVAQPGVTSAIIGPRTLEHLEDTLGVLDVELSESDLDRIDAIASVG